MLEDFVGKIMVTERETRKGAEEEEKQEEEEEEEEGEGEGSQMGSKMAAADCRAKRTLELEKVKTEFGMVFREHHMHLQQLYNFEICLVDSLNS